MASAKPTKPKAHKAQSPTQPNPRMGWALGPVLGPILL
ncbi:unnamed protein product [Penicillium camemberti]|uniref:Str. FM013 n=1 Tax=Penicillium camemberti (strain FM 013) TaxID=1429867 RepID=A0A0G4P588_PENC3|nr:unnamed protein product [Penicillium camemberti]